MHLMKVDPRALKDNPDKAPVQVHAAGGRVAPRDDQGRRPRVAWHLTGFFLNLCGAVAAFVPSAVEGLPDRTLRA